MADVISRLRLDSGEFDSKIKRAGQEIMAYSEHCRKMGLEMGYANKDAKDFAKSLGSMQTVSTSARGKINELSDAFVNLKVMYKNLTDEEKNNTFGKNLAASLDQLKVRIQNAKKDLADVTAELNGKSSAGGGLMSGIGSKMEGALAVFGGNMMTKASEAIVQLGSEMYGMVQQGIELARQGEGIRIAFERLGRGDILDGLREATHGTVTDLELMKAAVKFNDFKLPVEELGTMLAFAQQKAKDTGQSVDYMVDSIVTGLGRKSLMILDNLGLSASEIKERMKETGDMTKAVGSIIRDQMKSAGDYVETAADRAAQANVSLQNKMEELGRKFAPIEEASNQLWTSMKIGILDIIGGPLATMLNQLTEAGRLRNQLNKMNGDPSTGQPTKVQQQLSNLRGSNYKNANYKGQLSQYDKQISTYQTMIDNGGKLPGAPAGSGKDVRWLQSQMDALKVMRAEYVQGAKDIMKPIDANVKTDKAEQNVKTLTAQLKELEKQRKDAVKKGDQEQVEALTKQISQTKTNLGYLDPSAAKTTTGGKSKQQQAEDKVAAALQDYQQTIDKASLELKSGAATEADVKKKQLSAQERLYDAYGDAYALYKDPKYKDAQDKSAEEIVKLGGEVKAATEAQEAARKAARELETAQKNLAKAQQDLADAQASGDLKRIYAAEKKVETTQQAVTQSSTITVKVEGKEALEQLQKLEGIQTVKVNVEEGDVNLPQVPTNDETIKVNVEQGKIDLPEVPTDDQTIKVNVEEGNVNLPQVPTDDQTIKVNVVVDDAKAIQSIQQLEGVTIDVPVNYKPQGGNLQHVEVPLTTANLEAFTSHIKEELVNADLGSSVALSLQEGLSDATAICTILQTAIQNGIDTAQFDTSGLMKKLMNHEDISDEDIQAYVDQLNEKLKEKTDETEWPNVLIKFDADTKKIVNAAKQQDKEAKKTAMAWNVAASAVSSVGDALQKIEDPGLKAAGTVIQAISSIALGFAQAASAKDTTESGWAWLAWLAAGTAAMATTISTIHSLTGFANGGIYDAPSRFVPGNTYSGDNVMANGGTVGLNSGELILNISSQNKLAASLLNAEALIGSIKDYSVSLGNAQQTILAAQLEGSPMENTQTQPYIDGELLFLGLQAYGRRSGMGELVFSKQ